MPRQIQQLRIKSKPLNSLLLKNDPAAFPPERLKSALRVHKRQPQHDAHNLVEDDACKLSKSGLVHLDQAAIHCPRADGKVVLSNCRQQFVSLFNRRGQVSVSEENDFPFRFEHSVPHAVALAPVHAILQHPQICNAIRIRGGYSSRLVEGAIVNHEDFRLPRGRSHIRRNPVERSGQPQLLVVGRNDDGELYRCPARIAGRRGHRFRPALRLWPPACAWPMRESRESRRSAKGRSRILPRGYKSAAKCGFPLVDDNLSESRGPAIPGTPPSRGGSRAKSFLRVRPDFPPYSRASRAPLRLPELVWSSEPISRESPSRQSRSRWLDLAGKRTAPEHGVFRLGNDRHRRAHQSPPLQRQTAGGELANR